MRRRETTLVFLLEKLVHNLRNHERRRKERVERERRTRREDDVLL